MPPIPNLISIHLSVPPLHRDPFGWMAFDGELSDCHPNGNSNLGCGEDIECGKVENQVKSRI
jgi:hypothetical protein